MAISTLRYPWVPNEEEIVEYFAEPDRSVTTLRGDDPWSGGQVMFSYIHIDDACSIARKAVEADYAGHETFWAVAGDTTADEPTEALAAEFYPDADVRGDLEGHETLFDLSKAEELLGWTTEHSWRDY